MFYYINGQLTKLVPDCAVLDCGGVGYLLNISAATFGQLSRQHEIAPDGTPDGKRAKLYTYFSVKEDGQELYGFYTEEERDLFKLLITVSGIGPKGALSVLSTLSPAELIAAVSAEDAKTIARANGIGLKTAQKAILELKSKFARLAPAIGDTADTPILSSPDVSDDAVDALVVLGYTRAEASKAVKAVGDGTVEDKIRKALTLLMK